jgi:hypothetical protein
VDEFAKKFGVQTVIPDFCRAMMSRYVTLYRQNGDGIYVWERVSNESRPNR